MIIARLSQSEHTDPVSDMKHIIRNRHKQADRYRHPVKQILVLHTLQKLAKDISAYGHDQPVQIHEIRKHLPGCVLHADKIPKYHIPGHRSYIHSVKQSSYDRTEQGNPHHDSIL